MQKYQLQDTMNKTKKVNNLESVPKQYRGSYNKNFLFDFSLLEKHITDAEMLKDIKNQCYKYCDRITNKFVPFFKPCDPYISFDYYSGNLFFKPYAVYSNTKNKRVYIIMRLVKIEIKVENRNCIYDDFTTTKLIDDKIEFNNTITDCEIA